MIGVRLGVALLALVALNAAAASAGGRVSGQAGASVDVQILAFNDFRGYLEPPQGPIGRIGSTVGGGSEYLATHLQRLRAANPNTIVVATGDSVGGSSLESAVLHDEPAIEALDLLRLDLATVGPHALGKGRAELTRLMNGGCHPVAGCLDGTPFAGASFTALAANVLAAPSAQQLRAYAARRAQHARRLAAFKRATALYRKRLAEQKAACRKAPKTAKCTRDPRPPKHPGRAPAAPTAAPLFPATAVKEIGGAKVGFIGITSSRTPGLVPPAAISGLTFADEVETVNRYAAELERRGVSAIVVLLQEGGEQVWNAGHNECVEPKGRVFDLAARMTSAVDVVVAAHSVAALQPSYTCRVGGKLVTAAAAYGRLVTDIDLTVDTASGNVVAGTATNVVVTKDVPRDGAQTALIDRNRGVVREIANRVLGTVAGDLTRATNAAGEATLGDAVADSQLDSARALTDPATAFALVNHGALRADLLASQRSGGESPGQVTTREAFAVLPYGVPGVVVTCTGDQIKRALEQQFDNPTPGFDRMLQVSAGFSYAYVRSAPAGARVVLDSIRVGSEAVAPGTQYRVAINGYLAEGGDSFTVFQTCTQPKGSALDLEAFADYLARRSPLAVPQQGRIRRSG